ncbi:conserved exported protein of unknown function [Pararobbsia alpina]|uniref:tetratricopeptide repeat protein n=1 Tax=Pararobbsia alpina TaxID=621374 RepID=UPI0039A4AF26
MTPLIRSTIAVSCAAVLAALTACTTTVVTHAPEVRPVTENSNPSSVSEIRIADSALASGNIQLATSLYQKLVAADPKSVPGLTGLGDTLYAVGDFTRSGVQYERALQVDPTFYPAMLGAARVAIKQRRLDDAIVQYRKIETLRPNDALACAGLGTALDLNGDHAAAQAEFRRGLKANPGDPTLSVNLGMSLILAGNPREAVNVLLDVTRYPAAPREATQDLALAYGMLGNTEAASEILGEDMPKATVEDNLRFYAFQRERIKAARGTDNSKQPGAVSSGRTSESAASSVTTVSTTAIGAMPLDGAPSREAVKQ